MTSYGVGSLIVIVAVTLSIAALFLVRRLFSWERLARHRDVAAPFSNLLGLTYAIVVGFLVVMVWTSFQNTRTAVDHEANRLIDLARFSSAFSPQDAARARAAITAYGEAVVRSEWPAMRDRRDSSEGRKALAHLWATYRTIEPRTPREIATYEESLTALSDVSDSRHVRLHAVHEKIAGMMWILLAGGGALVIALTFFFATQNFRTQAAMTGALALLIAFNLFLIFSLDHPYSSGPGITAQPIQEALPHIAAADGE